MTPQGLAGTAMGHDTVTSEQPQLRDWQSFFLSEFTFFCCSCTLHPDFTSVFSVPSAPD